MLLVDDLAAGGTKNLRHTPRGLVTLYTIISQKYKFWIVKPERGLARQLLLKKLFVLYYVILTLLFLFIYAVKMASNIRAPKQWSLTKQETITSFESWRQNLQYTLALDKNFAGFLVDGLTWLKKTSGAPLRGFTDDNEPIPEEQRRTAAQKVTQLELMLGQIANFCPIISRNTFVKNSTSMASIWQAIRLHYGFRSTGAHFIDFNNIKLEPNERPEDLFQRLQSFMEDTLLRSDGSIRHHGDLPDSDEKLSPSLENLIVLTWLRLINPDLPALVKQRYGMELRSHTLASIKPEISQALDSLLDEINTSNDSKVLRASFHSHQSPAKVILVFDLVISPNRSYVLYANKQVVQNFITFSVSADFCQKTIGGFSSQSQTNCISCNRLRF